MAYHWGLNALVASRRYRAADDWYATAMQFVADHDQETWREWLRAWWARVLLDRGLWDEAQVLAADVYRRAPVDDGSQGRRRGVLGRLAARRGEPDSVVVLEETTAMVAEADDFVGWLFGLAPGGPEAAWYDGNRATIPNRLARPYEQARATGEPWSLGEVAYWLRRSGALGEPPDGAAAPYALQLVGRAREAADAWEELGCPYHAARALADSDDEGALREALATFDRLGARPGFDEVAPRLRRLGVRTIPRPRRPAAARGGPLSSREAQVLSLLADGLRNAEIAGAVPVRADGGTSTSR